MKKKDFLEFKNKTIDSLKKEIEKLAREKNEAKIERDMNKTKNVHTIISIKKNIAQIKTLINQKSFSEKLKEKKGQGTESVSS